MLKKSALFLFLISGLFVGCGDGDSTEPLPEGTGGSGGSAGSGGNAPGPIEIEGNWVSEYGPETIGEHYWETTVPAVIVEYSNQENYAVLRNPEDAEFNPGKYGRNVWTEIDDDSFYYCTVAYMSETPEATADDAEPADSSDPESGGCGEASFPWTKLTRQ